MDFLGDWLLLIIGIAVVGIVTVAGLLTRKRGKVEPPSGGTDVIAPPAEAPAEAPVEAPAAEAVEAPAPELERPEGTASRLVRLRQRLSKSQGGLGKGL